MKIGFWVKLAFLFIRRSWRSTVVLGIMVASAVAALTFLSSLAVGTNDAMVRNSVGLFSGHISAEYLPPAMPRERLLINGVKGAAIRKSSRVWLGHEDRLEVCTLTGIEPQNEKLLTALWRKTVAGRFPEGEEKTVFLSDAMSLRLGVKVGQEVNYGWTPGIRVGSMTVCGIFRTGISVLDNGMAFCPIQALPAHLGIFSAAVFLDDGVSPDAILMKFHQMSSSSRFRPWTEYMPDLKQLIDLNFVSMSIVMLLVFGIVSLGISCAFVIFILKGIREHGIMKAMGVLPVESTLLIASQVVLLTLMASLVGMAVGVLAVMIFSRSGIDLTVWTSHNQYFAVSGIIYPRLTVFSLCVPTLLALLFGLMAAVWPAAYVIRKKAAEILRST